MGEPTGLPASFETAWGVRERPTKGPRRARSLETGGAAGGGGARERPTKGPRGALSLERVVAAGVTVAAGEGIGAVSMSRVARELGTAALSLYRHVGAKDEPGAPVGDQ